MFANLLFNLNLTVFGHFRQFAKLQWCERYSVRTEEVLRIHLQYLGHLQQPGGIRGA
ncbi:hypothetical protein D3C84_1261180 [compost metagenome]